MVKDTKKEAKDHSDHSATMEKENSVKNGDDLKPRRAGVDHNYHDYSGVSAADACLLFQSAYGSIRQHNPLASGTQQQGFAVKLHYMLGDIETSGEASIVSWQPHGRSFVVHNRKDFVERVLPNYFLQSTFASFQRQLNLYGFKRISSGQDKGGYYNELFLRGKPELACFIQRIKRKGNGPRKPDSPDTEPDFYTMKYMPPHSETPSSMSQKQGLPPLAPAPPQHQQYQKAGNNSRLLSLRHLLPASLGAPQQDPQDQTNAAAQASLAMMQPQPLLPSSELVASFNHQLESTLSVSDSLSKQLEPTPINPASANLNQQGAPPSYPFAPLPPPPASASAGPPSMNNNGSNSMNNNGSNSMNNGGSNSTNNMDTLNSNVLQMPGAEAQAFNAFFPWTMNLKMMGPPPPLGGPAATNNVNVINSSNNNGPDLLVLSNHTNAASATNIHTVTASVDPNTSASTSSGTAPTNIWQSAFTGDDDIWSRFAS